MTTYWLPRSRMTVGDNLVFMQRVLIISFISSISCIDIMPRGIHFSNELKKALFCVITVVENKKDCPLIPLNNCNARLVAMLGISESSVLRVKSEMKMLQVAQEELQPHRLRSQSRARRPSKDRLLQHRF